MMPIMQLRKPMMPKQNPNYKFGPRVTVKPGDVISGDSVIGRDPDPSVRDELLREYDSGGD